MEKKSETNGRVKVFGKQVFSKEDQYGTIMAVFTTTLKVLLDDGRKFYVLKDHCENVTQHL